MGKWVVAIVLVFCFHLLLETSDSFLSEFAVSIANSSGHSYFLSHFGWNDGRFIEHYYIQWYFTFLEFYAVLLILALMLYSKVSWDKWGDKISSFLLVTYFLFDIILYVGWGNNDSWSYVPDIICWSLIALSLILQAILSRRIKYCDAHKIDVVNDECVYIAIRKATSLSEFLQSLIGLNVGSIKPIAKGWIYFFNRQSNVYIKKQIHYIPEDHKLIRIDINPYQFMLFHDRKLGTRHSLLTNCASILDTLKQFGYPSTVFPSLLLLRLFRHKNNQ